MSTSAKWAHLTCPDHRSAVGIQGEIDGAQACRARRLPGPSVFRSVVPDKDLTNTRLYSSLNDAEAADPVTAPQRPLQEVYVTE